MSEDTKISERSREQALAFLVDSGEIDSLTDILVGALREAFGILADDQAPDTLH